MELDKVKGLFTWISGLWKSPEVFPYGNRGMSPDQDALHKGIVDQFMEKYKSAGFLYIWQLCYEFKFLGYEFDKFIGKLGNLFQSLDPIVNALPEPLQNCFFFLSIFPQNYEFSKKNLIQLWITLGFIQAETEKLMEDTCGLYFDILVSLSFLRPSNPDSSTYTIPDHIYQYLKTQAAGDHNFKSGSTFTSSTSHSLVAYHTNIHSPFMISVIKSVCYNLKQLVDILSTLNSIPNISLSSFRCVHHVDLSGKNVKQIPIFIMSHIVDANRYLYADTEGVENLNDLVVYNEESLSTCTHDVFNLDTLSKNVKKCLLFTSLFPKKYEFKKDMLVQIWIAIGCIPEQEGILMEDTAAIYFDILLGMSFFQQYNVDGSSYTLEDDAYRSVQELAGGEYARLEDNNLNGINNWTLHSSVLYEGTVNPNIVMSFHKLERLHSLLLLQDSRKLIKEIPCDLIWRLKSIRVLDISETQIELLPNSVGELKELRYLNLSGTPIKRLPQSISKLCNLQTLKLRDCLNFVELPRKMNDVINLRHLELDILGQLTFLPIGMGRLSNLQSLSAFMVGKTEGFRLAELKNMINLRGSLCIVNLENTVTKEDAEKAALRQKKYLVKLELQWSIPCFEAMDILEGLEPHKNLMELEIVRFGSLAFPTWLGDSTFSNLAGIYIYDCKNCIFLPPLGQLPTLKSLQIRLMHALKRIDHQFCGSSENGGFSKLETLLFSGMPMLKEWTGVDQYVMSCLRKLTIINCPQLVELPELSNLISLQHLEINLCFKLASLAEKKLPISVQTLIISDCPKLKEKYGNEGVDWHKIADIPSIWIDYQQIS